MTSLDDFVSELNGQEMLTPEQQLTLEKARILKASPEDTKTSLSKYEREWLNDKELDFKIEYYRLRDLNFSDVEIMECWIKNITIHPIFRHCIAQLYSMDKGYFHNIHRKFYKHDFPIYELKEFDAQFPLRIDTIDKLFNHCEHMKNDEMLEWFVQKYRETTNREKEDEYVSVFNILIRMQIPTDIRLPLNDLFRFLIRKLLSFSHVSQKETVRSIVENWKLKGVFHEHPYSTLKIIACTSPYNLCHAVDFHKKFLSHFKTRLSYYGYYELK